MWRRKKWPLGITMEEVLELIDFERDPFGELLVYNIRGAVHGSILCDVCGNIGGVVCGKINGREWQFVETPKEKAIRLIREGKSDEAIKVLEEE